MSTEGERDPRWRRDENEIVYRDDAKVTLMSAAVKTEDGRFDVTGSSRCSDCPKPARGSRMTSPGRPKGFSPSSNTEQAACARHVGHELAGATREMIERQITALLQDIRGGKPEAMHPLIAAVCSELRGCRPLSADRTAAPYADGARTRDL
jgi:hypothetical protein